MSRLTILFLAVPALSGLLGCADAVSVRAQEQRVIQDASPDQVLTAAAALLQQEFGRVAVDRAARRIVTAPVEFTTQRESGTARDLYRGTSTMRRKAVFDVGRSGGVTVARLRVDIERRDTGRHVVMPRQAYRLSDTPGEETPIEADAATTGEQNAVWTRVRRDHSLERALLDELREQFARLSAPPEGSEAVEPRGDEPAPRPPAPKPRD